MFSGCIWFLLPKHSSLPLPSPNTFLSLGLFLQFTKVHLNFNAVLQCSCILSQLFEICNFCKYSLYSLIHVINQNIEWGMSKIDSLMPSLEIPSLFCQWTNNSLLCITAAASISSMNAVHIFGQRQATSAIHGKESSLLLCLFATPFSLEIHYLRVPESIINHICFDSRDAKVYIYHLTVTCFKCEITDKG